MQLKKTWTKIRRGVKYPVLVFFIRFFVATVRFFPRLWVNAIFAFFARIAFLIVRKERERTIKTLTLIYEKEKTPREIKRMGQEVFVNQALNFADYIHWLKWTSREQFSKVVDFVGEEHLREAYNRGKGVLCLMMHTGSWELSAIMPPILGYETTAVSKAMRNPKIDQIIVDARESRGMKNIARGKSYSKILESLTKGECMIIMIDQDTKVKGVFVDFFGRKAYTPDGAARIALDTHAPVLLMYMQRIENHRHRFTILPEIPLTETGDHEFDLYENTRIYTQKMEEVIREIPTQWVWMHERWKTTPEDVAQYLAQKKKKS
ncbi:MAG: lysophospholipid acyltransferase family protein [Dysgonamonadaceae bacterium]|jgi:KDO2-lipid IV(A) lauroyltransferase|nr:lysophospholipid acyltransferase family protein [Dysgonamonadaceae bacterium]